MTGPAGATVRLRRLSVVGDGDDVLVGDLETGLVPPREPFADDPDCPVCASATPRASVRPSAGR
ncbi:MAG: hypothetical protein ACRDNL_26515 [Spirillospora sp.]